MGRPRKNKKDDPMLVEKTIRVTEETRLYLKVYKEMYGLDAMSEGIIDLIKRVDPDVAAEVARRKELLSKQFAKRAAKKETPSSNN